MKYNQEKQDIIDRYVLARMNEEEQTAFEKELSTDAALREETELTRRIMIAFRKEEEQAALEAMKSLPEDTVRKLITSQQPAKQHAAQKRMLYIRIAATAAAAVMLVMLYIGNRPQYAPEELFAQYYHVQPYETYPSRGGVELSPTEKQMLLQAGTHYKKAEYQEALTIYEQLFAGKGGWRQAPGEAVFYAAICRFETGNPAGAIEQLEHIASDSPSGYQYDALWNLAFIYLKENQRNKAKECLNRLIEKETVYTVEAKELLKKIEEKRWL